MSSELRRMQRMNPALPEHSILRNYLECIADLPWSIHTKDRDDLLAAEVRARRHDQRSGDVAQW